MEWLRSRHGAGNNSLLIGIGLVAFGVYIGSSFNDDKSDDGLLVGTTDQKAKRAKLLSNYEAMKLANEQYEANREKYLVVGNEPAELEGQVRLEKHEKSAPMADGDFDDQKNGIFPLGRFTVNLHGNDGGKVLRMEIDLELNVRKVNAVQDKMAGLRDRVLNLVSNYAYEEIKDIAGKMRLQDAILADLNQYMGARARIHRVYFSQFAVQ